MTPNARFIVIFTLYKFLTNECDTSCVYLVAAIRKIKAKQRFYGHGLNRVQWTQKKSGKPPREYIFTEKRANTI